MASLEKLTHAEFEQCLEQAFSVDVEGSEVIELRLVNVSQPRPFNPEVQTRPGFSLIFRGPMTPLLPQRIHRLVNDRLGETEIFLVPIGPDLGGLCYEAVFN